MNGCERGADAGAWVLGALDDQETAGFEDHLGGCASCRAEVAALRTVVDALPLATEQVAPAAALKNRIMNEVETEAQLLRAAGPDADRVHRRAAAQRGLRRRRPSFSVRPLAAAGLAAAILAVGVIGGVVLGGGSSLQTRTVQAQVAMPGASAVVLVRDGHARLEVRGMRNPPAGRVYQVWLKRGSKAPEPTDVLFTVRAGHSSVDLPGSVNGVDQVMVTSEPPGGSRAPTSKPVISAAV
jgi:anti-sigma factor RsiW